MTTSSQHNFGFSSSRRAASALGSLLLVASVASAIGFVSAVLVLTKPTRTSVAFAPLPAVAWEVGR